MTSQASRYVLVGDITGELWISWRVVAKTEKHFCEGISWFCSRTLNRLNLSIIHYVRPITIRACEKQVIGGLAGVVGGKFSSILDSGNF